MKIANKVRTYEIALSRKYKGGEFKPKNLWDSEEELEFLEINNMGDLANAIQRGAPKPPQSLIEFIRNGGSTSFPLHGELPPKFFRLPSNYEGGIFSIGKERTNQEIGRAHV